MAVYSRGGNLPTTTDGGNSSTYSPSQSVPLASKDLGSIIVKTLETVSESLSGNDVPVSYKDVEKAVTQGVNKSDLVKKGLKNGTLGQVASGGLADKALAEKYEQDKYIKWQEWQKKLQKEDERNREELKQKQQKDLDDMKRKVDETWSGIATALDNPLKGISNLLDKTVKDFSTGFLKGYKDAKNKNNKGGENEEVSIGSVTPSPEVKPITDKLDDLNDLITDNLDEIKDNQEVLMDGRGGGKDSTGTEDEWSDLIKNSGENTQEGNESNNKQKSDEEKAKEDDKKKRDEKQLNATQSVGYAVGNIVGSVGKILVGVLAAVAVGSQLIMFVKGKLYKILEESPAKWDIRIAKLRANLEAIPEKIKLGAEQILSKIKFPGFSYGGLSAEEEDRWVELHQEKQQLEKETKSFAKQEGKIKEIGNKILTQDEVSQYNLATEEGREGLKQAIIEKSKTMDPEVFANIGYRTDEIEKEFKRLDKSAKNVTPETMKRLADVNAEIKDLDDKMENKVDYNAKFAEIDTNIENRTAEILSDSAVKRAEKGEYIQTYKATLEREGYGGAITMAEQKYEDKYGERLNTAPLTERETWIKEKYEPWENAWKDFGKNMKMDLNIETQRPARRNALNVNGNQ